MVIMVGSGFLASRVQIRNKFTFHMVLLSLGKVWIQLWENSFGTGTKCDTIFWGTVLFVTLCLVKYQLLHYGLNMVTDTDIWQYTGHCQLLFVMLLFGYSTKCNNVLAQRHCNNIVATTTNADTSTKCNTIVHDICSIKCNNNDWSYPGNGTKCGTLVIMVLLLWFCPGKSAKCSSRLFINPLCPFRVWKIHR